MIKQLSTAVFALLALQGTAQQIEKPGLNSKTSFAIVTDQVTLQKTGGAIKAYKQALEKDGLGTYIISGDWKNPDEIRAILQKLYLQPQKLEGAVFVGDIPVPMIRDAQYLTSAFKMDQRINWQRSSVPSDRFYDDFDLKFNFIKQDSAKSNYFYYSLHPGSPQHITMDIYSGRIKPPAVPGKDKYQLIEQYLLKVAAEKNSRNPLNDFFVFTGQGYNSESLNSWAGEQIALREQFSDLFKPGNTIKFMNFRMGLFMKFNLMSELKREELDMAIFHEHGADDQQLINGYSYVSNPLPSIENVRRYLRSKVRAAAEDKKRDLEQVKTGFTKSLGVPASWMEDALADSMRIADSIFEANLNINMPDVINLNPNARFVMLDACFNGSFHKDDYIAGYYPFGEGKNIVTVANSIGVLQDLWPDEMLGLLQYGVRAGNWLKQIAYLETHILGDPTFHFSGKTTTNINEGVVLETKNAAYWQTLLKHTNPDVQALALAHLFAIKGAGISELLKSTYFNSPYGATRMEALKLLAKLNNKDCREVLKASINDPYEYIRRQTAYIIADMGDDDLIPAMVQLAITDRHSKRVASKARDGLEFMNTDKVIAEIKRQIASSPYLVDAASLQEQLIKEQEYTKTKLAQDLKTITDTSLAVKERLFEITILRTYNYHRLLPHICNLILNKNENRQLRLASLEVLSWYNLSYQKPLILETCRKVIEDPSVDEELKNLALKTKNRVSM